MGVCLLNLESNPIRVFVAVVAVRRTAKRQSSGRLVKTNCAIYNEVSGTRSSMRSETRTNGHLQALLEDAEARLVTGAREVIEET